ncbi:MAG: DUF2878 domain-containing protein [Methylococcaceae bacterium]|jgi:hypothetical protein|nr:DUF2878 domain-containing protein [Methylococcaceae bacterium]MDP3389263.1 DUF2878 domain-containing protein [Methylococcaceae bacterium]MDP3932273.1 DUF2878 domain-containing protein [Methylococcaceae bacterium]
MKPSNLINMIWMQALWFAAVVGAGKDTLWLAPIVLALFVYWQTRPVNHKTGDYKLVLVAVVLGFILDSAWIKLGWLEFSGNWPAKDQAPLWILFLWAGLALTLNHSLAWLQSKLWLAALLGGISGPLSYLGASRLDAVTITTESSSWFIGLGSAWALALPLLLWLAARLQQKEQDYV